VRPKFERVLPVHVALRMKDHVWNLRARRCLRRIEGCLVSARGRFGTRIVEYSILGNHLHLIVEADGSEALSRGMQGLCIRIAKSLNALMGRAGRVFDDHYFARLLRTPTELTRAIAYVLGNSRRHFGIAIDSCSSAALPATQREELTSPPRGWLLRQAWRQRAGQ
jgi:hypothetical protein